MKTLKEKLGARIKEIRQSRNLTQEKLCELIDMDKPNLSIIECGKRFMKCDTLEKIAKALKVEEKVLFDFGHLDDRDEIVKSLTNKINNASLEELKCISKVVSAIEDYKTI